MKKALLFCALMLGWWTLPAQAVTCHYYAANNGTGNGLAAGTPFKISDFWALGQATIRGKTLCLNNGTYQGADNMIAPTTGINGASGLEITVAAVNEGSVLIDGQFARSPIVLTDNQYFRIEGVNACCSGAGRAVVTVNGAGSHSWFKRIVAWDQLQTPDSGNAASIFSVQAIASDILFEDVAGFGNAQRIARCAFGAADITYRRLFARLDGPSAIGGPASIFNITRNSETCTLENGILQWLGNVSGGDIGNGLLHNTDLTNGTAKIYGTLIMDKAAATGSATGSMLLWLGSSTRRIDPVTIQDVVVYAPTASLQSNGVDLRNCSAFNGVVCSGNSVTRLTNIAASGHSGPGIGSEWTTTNYCSSTSFTGCGNIFTGANAANLCFRYEGGALTATPLWPWPMDARINAAITATGKTALTGGTVTAEIEALGAGDIPASCRSDAEEEPFAEFTGFPTTSQISAFSGSAAPPTGFTTLTGNGWTEAAGVAVPTSGFSVMQTSTTYDSDQEAWCDGMVALPATGGASGFGVNFLIKGATDRYLVNVFSVTGSNNDALYIQRRTSTGTQTLATTQLGYDLATGDAVGVRVVDNAITATIKRASEGVWRIIATATAADPGQATAIGLGADVASCTSFGGGAFSSGGDVTAPTAPSNLTVTPSGAVSILLDWDASTDAVGVTGYRVYRGLQSNCSDCAVIATVTTTDYDDATATLGTTSYYKITAIDAATNESSASSIVAGRIPDGPAAAGGSGRLR